MKKMILAVAAVAAVGGWASSSFAAEFVPTDLSVCKEQPFSGTVSKGVQAAGYVDAIEVIDRGTRKKAAERFKAKRIRIQDGVAVALMDSDTKKCINFRKAEMPTESDVQSLLQSNETITLLAVTSEKGDHHSVAVWGVK